jgi:hypothetical protein
MAMMHILSYYAPTAEEEIKNCENKIKYDILLVNKFFSEHF